MSNVKIIQGDCLEIMPTLADKSVDMILCDLPYGTTACKWDTIIPFKPLWKQYKRLIKGSGAIVLTASQPFTSALVMSNPRWFKYEWIWEKSKATGHLLSRKRPLKIHENILIFYSIQPTYNPQNIIKGVFKTGRTLSEEKSKNNVYGNFKNGGVQNIGNFPKSIQKINNPSNSGNLHPTQKPVALFEYLIRTYTNEGDMVLDNCAGSFTTAIACMNTNREYICIEKDEKYFEIGKKRIAEHEPLWQMEGEFRKDKS